jgi:GDP-mannose 6-dehydrogenase
LARKLDLTLPVLDHVLESNRMVVERGLKWILETSKKRIAFLGISYKMGTDDVRESPFVELVERLLGKGRTIRIFDHNVHLANLIGANKEYLLSVLPHVADLMVPDISGAVDWAELIVVTTPDPAYKAALSRARSDQMVLDLAGLAGSVGSGIRSEGFLW